MRIAIIGGGIAGLTQGILLKNEGYHVTVFERSKRLATKGHAFMMSGRGLELLESLNTEKNKPMLKKEQIELFNLRSPRGEDLLKISLDNWNCLKRVDLIRYLSSFYNSDELKYDYEFSHFKYNRNGWANSVAFKNGAAFSADIFIGADGSNSKVRQHMFGSTKYNPIEVKEVVGISSNTAKPRINIFEKIQSKSQGLAFGNIPVSDNESVWFMQYDAKLERDKLYQTPDELKNLCRSLLKEFPAGINDLIEAYDFENAYKWNTCDFDLLPSFHRENIVLIGDAAHLFLTFTSSGTTEAITDAEVLTKFIINEVTPGEAFWSYYLERREEVASKLSQGRELKRKFLEPNLFKEETFKLPLVSVGKEIKKEVQVSKTYSI